MIDKIRYNLIVGLLIYSLTIIIPIALSFIFIFSISILGLEPKYDIWLTFKMLWIGYYFTGFYLGIIAWKWHIILFILSVGVTIEE